MKLGRRVGSAVKSSGYFFRSLDFDSQHLLGGSQHSLTPLRGDPMTSSGLHLHQAYMHAQTSKTTKHIHLEIKNKQCNREKKKEEMKLFLWREKKRRTFS